MTFKPDTTANLAISLLCLLVGVRVLLPAGESHPVPYRGYTPPIYAVGEPVTVPGLDFARAARTLVLVVRSTCIHCTESLPFYRSLRREQIAGGKVRLVAVGLEEYDRVADYLARNGIQVDQVIAMKTRELKVPGTPTAILVDRAGAVVQIWPGRLSPDKETELIAAVRADPVSDVLLEQDR